MIPQTADSMRGEQALSGARAAAEKTNFRVYWTAPTSEEDIAGQVSLIGKVSRWRRSALLLAPNHPLTVLVPVRRVLEAGLPVVLISSELSIPAGDHLGYVINDDNRMGELAAQETARLLRGRGQVAIVGLGNSTPGVMRRARAAEQILSTQFPGLDIVARIGSPTNIGWVEEQTTAILQAHSGLKAIVSLTAASTRGAHSALRNRQMQGRVVLVGCEQDSDIIAWLRAGEVDGVVAENSYQMGYEGVRLISAILNRKPVPLRTVVPPTLLTRDNVDGKATELLTAIQPSERP